MAIEDLYLPADQSNLGYDVNGDLLTNPSGPVHNGNESSLLATDVSLLTNPFWSSNGIDFDHKSLEELITHDGSNDVYTNSVTIESGNIVIDQIITEKTTGIYTNLSTPNLDFNPNSCSIVAKFNISENWTSIDRPIFQKSRSVGEYVLDLSIVGDNNKTISFTGMESSIVYGITSSDIIVNDGIDHIVVGTFDGTTWNIYVDTKLINTTIDAIAITNVDDGCVLGQNINLNRFEGNIGNVSVYDSVLTQVDVIEISKILNNTPTYVAVNTQKQLENTSMQFLEGYE